MLLTDLILYHLRILSCRSWDHGSRQRAADMDHRRRLEPEVLRHHSGGEGHRSYGRRPGRAGELGQLHWVVVWHDHGELADQYVS